jgi:hypothetical protein
MTVLSTVTGQDKVGGQTGGRVTHQLADPVQVVQKVLHRLALSWGKNTQTQCGPWSSDHK